MNRQILQEVKEFRRSLPLEALYKSYLNGKECEIMEAYLELTPGQSYGPKAESWYRDMTKTEKIPASKEKGDFRCQTNGKCGEYKFSYAKEDKKRKFNFVQIRPWHDIIGYALEVYVEGEGFYIFNIGKNNMMLLLKQYGGLAHGVKKNGKIHEEKEYALRGMVGGALWNDLKKYHDSNLFTTRETKDSAF